MSLTERSAPGEDADTRLRALVARSLEAAQNGDLEQARAATAEALGRRRGLAPQPEPDLRETDVGAWSGRLHAEIEERWPEELARFRAGDDHVRPGGGESRAMLRGRVLGAIGRIAGGGRGPVALVTHLGVVRALRPGLSLGNGASFWWPGAPIADARAGSSP